MAIEAKADFLRQLEAELSAATVFGVATMPWWA